MHIESRLCATESESESKIDEQETVVVVLVRDEGTCTVAWPEVWHSDDQMPETWPTTREVVRSVERVVAKSVTCVGGKASLRGVVAFCRRHRETRRRVVQPEGTGRPDATSLTVLPGLTA